MHFGRNKSYELGESVLESFFFPFFFFFFESYSRKNVNIAEHMYFKHSQHFSSSLKNATIP